MPWKKEVLGEVVQSIWELSTSVDLGSAGFLQASMMEWIRLEYPFSFASYLRENDISISLDIV